MKVIFAQGNPGLQYAKTRHNIGFIMIDLLAKKWNVEFIQKPKFHALVAEHTLNGEKILLVKPTTFYNETGQSAKKIVDFYKLNSAADFLVIHDDLALPFGTIRTRPEGSDAGNNGVKSLNAHLGAKYFRIRVGIYNEKRDRMDDVNFVLGMFTREEQSALPLLFTHVERFVDGFTNDSFELTKVRVETASLDA